MAIFGIHSNTNEFRVSDEAAYQKLYARITGDVQDHSRLNPIGEIIHSFSGGNLGFLLEDPEKPGEYEFESDMYDFALELKNILPAGEVFAFTEIKQDTVRGVGSVVYMASDQDVESFGLGDYVAERTIDLKEKSLKISREKTREERRTQKAVSNGRALRQMPY